MKRTNTILYLVVPCYNEEEVLHKSAAVLLDKLDRLIQAGTISDKSKILFINDGSKDSTWQIIYELTRQNSKYAGLSFSRNYGHQSAILAGMMAARSKADAVVQLMQIYSRILKHWISSWNAIRMAVRLSMACAMTVIPTDFSKRRQQDCFTS